MDIFNGCHVDVPKIGHAIEAFARVDTAGLGVQDPCRIRLSAGDGRCIFIGSCVGNHRQVRINCDRCIDAIGDNIVSHTGPYTDRVGNESYSGIGRISRRIRIGMGVGRDGQVLFISMNLNSGKMSQADLERLDPAQYSGTTHTGKIGVERAEESALHGSVGFRQVLVNAEGRIIQELERTRPVPGHDVTLTLDLELQLAAESALEGRRGAVVAVDPANGHVLALVSQPGYDPNLFAAGISTADYHALRDDRDTPLFNRALAG